MKMVLLITMSVTIGFVVVFYDCGNIQEKQKTGNQLQKTETIKKNPETPGQLDCIFEEELENLLDEFGPV